MSAQEIQEWEVLKVMKRMDVTHQEKEQRATLAMGKKATPYLSTHIHANFGIEMALYKVVHHLLVNVYWIKDWWMRHFSWRRPAYFCHAVLNLELNLLSLYNGLVGQLVSAAKLWKVFIPISQSPKWHLLLLSNQQSKTWWLFLYYHKWRGQAVNPHSKEPRSSNCRTVLPEKWLTPLGDIFSMPFPL